MGDLGVLAQMFTYRSHAILSFSIAQIRGQVPVPSLIQRAFHRGRDTPSFVLFFFSPKSAAVVDSCTSSVQTERC